MTTAAPAAAAPAAAAPAAAPAAGAGAPPAAAPAAAAAPAKAGSILGGDGSEPKPTGEGKGAPEKYADFTLPEGVVADAKLLDGFKNIAKEHGLSQEAAQKFVDLQAQNVKAAIDGHLSSWTEQQKTWGEEARKLFGDKAEAEFAVAAKAVERFGEPGLRQYLTDSGLGNHPLLVKMLNKIGHMISEDPSVEGRKAGGGEQSTASLMFPTMQKK